MGSSYIQQLQLRQLIDYKHQICSINQSVKLAVFMVDGALDEFQKVKYNQPYISIYKRCRFSLQWLNFKSLSSTGKPETARGEASQYAGKKNQTFQKRSSFNVMVCNCFVTRLQKSDSGTRLLTFVIFNYFFMDIKNSLFGVKLWVSCRIVSTLMTCISLIDRE